MEMCYDGALVMPSGYAVMNEDEMIYVEGGVKASLKWYGVQLKLSASETNTFIAVLGTGSGGSWLAAEVTSAGIVSLPASIPFGLIAAAIGTNAGIATLVNCVKKGKGININLGYNGMWWYS